MARASTASLGPYSMGSGSYQTAFKIERQNAARLGNRANGEGSMGTSAIRGRGTRIAPQKTVVPLTHNDEHEAAIEFSAVIIPFSVGELSQAARRTKEAAKKWKQGRSMPSAWSLLKMANQIPEVRAWVMGKLSVPTDDLSAEEHLRYMSPRAVQAVMAAAYQVMHQQNPDGDEVRAALEEGRKRGPR